MTSQGEASVMEVPQGPPEQQLSTKTAQGGGDSETRGSKVRQVGGQPGRSNYQGSGQDHKRKTYR